MPTDTETMTDKQRDAALIESVKEAFVWAPALDSSHIVISASDGVVGLAGEVPEPCQVGLAGEIVLALPGVMAVANDATVRYPARSARPDRLLARCVREELEGDSRGLAERVKVSVCSGEVSLVGCVATEAERRRAEELAAATPGVARTHNLLTLREGSSDD